MTAPDPCAAPAPLCIALVSSQLDMSFLLPAFRSAFPDATFRVSPDLGERADIDVAVCWVPTHGELGRMPNLRLIQSVGAGIDHITADPDLPDVPICRIIDPDMAAGMVAYVTWAVVHHQRRMGAYLISGAKGQWTEQPIVPPARHRVGIVGLGTLGTACARALAAIGYDVRGWSRSAKTEVPEGVQAFHGDGQRDAFLNRCDTLICLLPLTDDTRGTLCKATFDHLSPGAHLINVGRGDHLVEADLLAALDAGQLGAATLDTFSVEPLPADHAFWSDPRIIVTPHIATRTEPSAIARQTAANLHRIGSAALAALDGDRRA